MQINKYIDHTLLKPTATFADYDKLCAEAIAYGFKSVCVLPAYVPYCVKKLSGSAVLVCSVVSFPLGQDLPQTKVAATSALIANGATEIDFVINYGMAAQGETAYVEEELRALRSAAGKTVLKAILETSALTPSVIVKMAELCVKTGIDFVKTSTGTTAQGATPEVVRLIKKTVGDRALIKAAGGIRSLADAQAMIQAGADRLGTSQGVLLVSGTAPSPGAY